MTTLPTARRTAEIDAFLEQLKIQITSPTASGRLIFALDATASRQPTWDTACAIQGEMFDATTSLGKLDVQLLYYRCYNECKASRWLNSAAELHRAMRSVSCVGGHTQIGRVLDYVIKETSKSKVGALIFVGDACEEQADPLCRRAGELGKSGTPIFIFQEGHSPAVSSMFKQLAQLSGGAHLGFDLDGIAVLKTLVGAIAAFTVGGRPALESYSKGKHEVLRLTVQLGC